MFGYIQANQSDLTQEEKARYQAAYCGLCHALGSRYGICLRLALHYDLVFLNLLLSSLYEPEEKSGASRCIVHPYRRHPYAMDAYTDYAADMTGRHQSAIGILTCIPSAVRNARWYYLSALANHGLDNTVMAIDHMQRAVQMDPDNRAYRQLLQRLRSSGQAYERNAQGFNTEILRMQRLWCFGCMAAQFCCGPLSCMRCS